MTALIWVVGALAVACAAMVVLAAKTIYSALWLVANMVLLAVLFLLLNAQFLAAVQIIIYAGAVMVLFVFIIALLSPGSGTDVEEHRELGYRELAAAAIVVVIVGSTYVLAGNGRAYDLNGDHQLRGAALAQAAESGGGPGGAGRTGPNGTAVILQYNPDDVNSHGNVQTTGEALFSRFLLPFEVTSLLLLVAAIGAVYLTRRHLH